MNDVISINEEKEPKLRPKQKLFLDYYLDINSSETFGNGSKSYLKAYGDVKSPEVNASKMLITTNIKAWLEWYYKKNIPSKDQLTSEIYSLSKSNIRTSDRIRTYELICKVLGYTSDGSTGNTNILNIFDDAMKAKLNKYIDVESNTVTIPK